MAVISCIACSYKLRVPDDKRGTVTCPNCRATWFYPETLELSDVEFRCSFTGAKFNVLSSRRSPLHTFTIQAIKKPENAVPPSSKDERPSFRQAVTSVTPSLPPSPRGVGGFLARFLGREPVITESVAKPDGSEGKPADPPTVQRKTYNANEYNWNGFSCPYCKATCFVSCRGGHLACDGSSDLRDSRKFHQCFCGHAGFITGTIKTLESKRLSVDEKPGMPTSLPPDHSSASQPGSSPALPSPRRRGGLLIK
jgi:hypothetical protein